MKHIQNRWADTQMRPHLPLGCDQQGRYPEAAHAASELDDELPSMTRAEAKLVTLIWIASAGIVAILGAHILAWWGVL
jgi:hypothetical protein